MLELLKIAFVTIVDAIIAPNGRQKKPRSQRGTGIVLRMSRGKRVPRPCGDATVLVLRKAVQGDLFLL